MRCILIVSVVLIFISLSLSASAEAPMDKQLLLSKVEKRELSFRSDHLFWLTKTLNHEEFIKFSNRQKLANPNFDAKYLKKRFVIDASGYHHDFIFDYIGKRCMYATYTTGYNKQVRDCRDAMLNCTYDKNKSGDKQDILKERSDQCQSQAKTCSIDHSKYKEQPIDLKYCKIIYGD